MKLWPCDQVCGCCKTRALMSGLVPPRGGRGPSTLVQLCDHCDCTGLMPSQRPRREPEWDAE